MCPGTQCPATLLGEIYSDHLQGTLMEGMLGRAESACSTAGRGAHVTGELEGHRGKVTKSEHGSRGIRNGERGKYKRNRRS